MGQFQLTRGLSFDQSAVLSTMGAACLPPRASPLAAATGAQAGRPSSFETR